MWKALVVLLVFYKHISSQPIETDVNDRSPRQLDFGKCCPCMEKSDEDIRGDDTHEDSMGDGLENVFSGSSNDCPCRFRDSDSQGASSVFFPNTMRSDENFLKTTVKKESLKPLFNPEVDLASSVLETLKEVTDEEYVDALARDAAKSAAKAAGDFMFGDATPQESANIVTIVVKPDDTDFIDDDVIPDDSHIHKSRCIHSIESPRNNLAKMRVAPKSNFVFQKPRLSKTRPGIIHRHFNDLDSSLGASNIYEKVVPVNIDAEDLETNPLNLRTITDNPSLNKDLDYYCNLSKVPDFRSAHRQNKLKNLRKPSLLQSTIRDNAVNSFSRVPKRKLDNLIPDRNNERENNGNFDRATSATYEPIGKKLPYFKTNRQWESVTERNSPLSLANLLNLRDVEIIPLKKLFSPQLDSVKNKSLSLVLPSFSSNDDGTVTPRDGVSENYKTPDLKPSSSLVNSQAISNAGQINEDVCVGSAFEHNSKYAELKDTSIEDIKPSTNTNFTGYGNNVIGDLISDTSNHIKKITEEPRNTVENYGQSSDDENIFTEELYYKRDQHQDSTEIHDAKPKPFDPISVGETVSNIRKSIAKKLDNLKSIGTSIKNKKQELYNIDLTSYIPESRHSIEVDEKQNGGQAITISPAVLANHWDEKITTFKPSFFGDILEDSITTVPPCTVSDNVVEASKYDPATEVSLQDLQTLSNSLLQHEERDIISKSIEDTNLDKEDFTETTENIDRDENRDNFVNLTNTSNENDNISEGIILENLTPYPVDTDIGTSGVTVYVVPKNNENLSLEPISPLNMLKEPLSDINAVLNIPPLKPLTTLDDIKVKLANLFDKSDRDANKMDEPDDLKWKNTEKDNCKSDLVTKNTPQTSLINANIEASNMIMNAANEDVDVLGSEAILKPQISSLNESPLPVSNMPSLMPLPTFDNIRMKLTNLFKKNDDNTNLGKLSESDYVQAASEMENIDNSKQKINLEDYGNSDIDISSKSALFDTNIQTYENSKLKDDIKESLSDLNNILDKQASKESKVDLDDSDQAEHIKDLVDNFTDFEGSSEQKNNYNGDSTLPRVTQPVLIDSSGAASDIITKDVCKNNDNISLQPELKLPKGPVSELSNIINIPFIQSLPTLDDIKVEPPNIFDRIDRDIEMPNHNKNDKLETSMASTLLDPLSTSVTADTSPSRCPSGVSPIRVIDDGNLDIWQTKPQSEMTQNVPKFNLRSYKPKLSSLELNIRPTNLQSALQYNEDVKEKMSIDDSRQLTTGEGFQSSKKAPLSFSIKKRPNEVKERVADSSVEATNQLYSSFRNLKSPVEAKFHQATNNNLKALKETINSSPSILDTISRNHEELNNKFKNLHMDFNDRLEYIRNNLMDRSKLQKTSEYHNTKPQYKSSSNLIKQSKAKQRLKQTWSALNTKQPLESLVPLKSTTPKSIKMHSLQRSGPKIFKMPTAASVPIPKTVEVPELKMASQKFSPFSLQRRAEVLKTKETYDPSERQASKQARNVNNTPLRKQNNNKKAATIKVSFSTTPSPRMSSDFLKDHSHVSPDKLVVDRQERIRASPLEIPFRKPNDLKSWPKATESSFLSKVKDAAQARLSTKSPILEKFRLQGPDWKNGRQAGFDNDMTRAASENKGILDEPLKENISYKCKMVCGKE